MLRLPTFHRPEREKARSHLTMFRFTTFRWLEHEKARSHLTRVRFPTFHRPEHEEARSHLTIHLTLYRCIMIANLSSRIKTNFL